MYSPAIENYLKTIYDLQDEHGKVATTALAERLSVTPASVTNMVKKLAELHLVTYEPYQGLVLTESGQRAALKVVRCHRLVELFLLKSLGLSWDQVHAEAEKWEHVVSEEMTERIDVSLGRPTTDPHGSPIPTRDGLITPSASVPLTELQADQSAVIAEVRDRNPALLHYLGGLGLYPGVDITVIANTPFAGSIKIRLEERESILGYEAAQHIFVTENRAVADEI